MNSVPPFYYVSANTGVEILRATIPGKPVALSRPRLSRARIYCPNGNEIAAFRNAVRQHAVIPPNMEASTKPRKAKKADESAVYYGVWVIFSMPRPKYHFVNNDDQRRVKLHFSGNRFVGKRPDLDNMVKFVLDALNGIAYDDDKSVVELHTIKKWANDDQNEGSTSILVKKFDTNVMEE